MLVELLLVCALLLFSAGWGAWMKRILGIQTSSIVITSLLGLCFFAMICCVVLFFMPVRLWMEIAFIALALSAYGLPKTRAYIDKFPVQVVRSAWFWVFAAIVLLAGSYFAFVPDQFGYYIPTLTWLNDFGLIPGVSNIDWSISQMSLFHILEAGLDESVDCFLRINIYIVLLYLVYVMERKAYLLLLFVPFYFLFIQSLSPDVPVALISLIIVNEIYFHYNKEALRPALILSAFLFALKPTAFWALLWVSAIFLFKNRTTLFRKGNLPVYVAVGLLLLLVVAKNIVSSSTVIFPATFPHLDTWWQTSSYMIDYMQEVFQSKPFNLHYTATELASMSIFERFVAWITFDDLRSRIHLFVILVWLFFGVYAFIRKNGMMIVFWSVIAIKIVFSFLFSGQFRFMLDGLWPLLFILLMQIRVHRLSIKLLALTLFVTAGVALSFPKLLLSVFPKTYTDWMIEGFTPYSLLRPETDYLEEYSTATIGNLTFHIATAYIFTLDTPQPAFTLIVLQQYASWGVFPQMKDPENMRKGIYMKTLSEEEKEKLEDIIRSVK